MFESCCWRRRERQHRRNSASSRGDLAGRKYDAVDANDSSGGEESGLLGYHSGEESTRIGSRIPVARSLSTNHLSSKSDDENDSAVDSGREGRVLNLVGVKVLEVPKALFDSATLVFEIVETPPGSEERIAYRSWEHCTVNVSETILIRNMASQPTL